MRKEVAIEVSNHIYGRKSISGVISCLSSEITKKLIVKLIV